jgi:hypothetical protein
VGRNTIWHKDLRALRGLLPEILVGIRIGPPLGESPFAIDDGETCRPSRKANVVARSIPVGDDDARQVECAGIDPEDAEAEMLSAALVEHRISSAYVEVRVIVKPTTAGDNHLCSAVLNLRHRDRLMWDLVRSAMGEDPMLKDRRYVADRRDVMQLLQFIAPHCGLSEQTKAKIRQAVLHGLGTHIERAGQLLHQPVVRGESSLRGPALDFLLNQVPGHE